MASLLLSRLLSSAARPLLRLPLPVALPAPLRPPPGLPPPPALGFKTKAVLRRRCAHCRLVKRRGRWFVYCSASPKHKQRQM
ncbi:large ribosomal subunit protein bL36m [Cynocephalus volans]|uniref:large ribosomal subunit protein bL36m n=1 Tax=Cynocephalus volans TaxID=110931 RepID=UPI002FC7677A